MQLSIPAFQWAGDFKPAKLYSLLLYLLSFLKLLYIIKTLVQDENLLRPEISLHSF